LDPNVTPIIEQWFVEKWIVPTLVGYISYPDNSLPRHGNHQAMSFTAPLHLFSLQGGMARSSQRWYRLGCPSPIAQDSLRGWDKKGGC
jgi:hypothetical protein